MIPQKRVAIYARVSTTDRGHDPETQLLVLREYVARRGFMCVGEYVEYASGTGEDRPRYRALPKSARKRQLDDAARVSSDSREGGYDVCYRRAAVA